MQRVYYFGFYNNGGARVIVFPPFGETRTPSFTTFATARITKDN
jgi:hypothetical protein